MRKIIFMLAAAMAVVAFVADRSTPAAAQEKLKAPPPATVELAVAERQTIAPSQWVPGTVLSRQDARVASELAGRVLSATEVGTRVARGGELARLDDEALRLQARQDSAAVARIEAQLDFAERQVERLQALAGQSSIAATQLDQARSERDMQRADLARARATREDTERRIRAAVVRAPFAGIVAERLAQAGETVAAGGAIVRLVDVDAVEIEAQAPAIVARAVTVGGEVEVRDRDSQGHATVRAVVPVGDLNSRQFAVRLALDATRWPVGSAVEVALPLAAGQQQIAVPRDALILRSGASYVFRIDERNQAHRIDVTLGAAQGDWVAVSGAVEAGDRLVVRGAERLEEGQTVAPREAG